MKFEILCVGKIKEDYYEMQMNELIKNINKGRHSLQIIEFPDVRIPEHLSKERKEVFLEKECEKLVQHIHANDYVIALCIEGKEMTSGQHFEILKKAMDYECERIIYIIGGSLGLPENIKQRANLKLSFSKMTFPHQMMRMVLCEELAGIICDKSFPVR